MKRFFIVLLALILCLSVVSCGKKTETEAESNEAVDMVTPVSGKWTCSVKLSHVMTEAQHSVWSEKMEGDITFTLVFENDGNVKIFANTADATEIMKKYFVSEGYSEDAADLAAKHNAKDLAFGDELKNLKYTFAENKVELSSKATLKLSEDGKKLTPVLDTSYVYHDGEEKCQWFDRLINEMEFERA